MAALLVCLNKYLHNRLFYFFPSSMLKMWYYRIDPQRSNSAEIFRGGVCFLLLFPFVFILHAPIYIHIS